MLNLMQRLVDQMICEQWWKLSGIKEEICNVQIWNWIFFLAIFGPRNLETIGHLEGKRDRKRKLIIDRYMCMNSRTVAGMYDKKSKLLIHTKMFTKYNDRTRPDWALHIEE